jgi:Methyltransferase domain
VAATRTLLFAASVGLLDRLGALRIDALSSRASSVAAPFPTKALQKFLTSLTSREAPVLLDLGPVVGKNVSFFGEQLGCKIFVEDLYAELDRYAKDDKLEVLPEFLTQRFSQADGTVDGILCWDVFDYLARPAAQALAAQLMRVLRPEGALLTLFATTPPHGPPHYTKYVVADETSLIYRTYPAGRARQTVLLSRDLIRLFGTLQVADSFLLQNNVRELLFRKPA